MFSKTKYFDTKGTDTYGDLSQLDTPLRNGNSLLIKDGRPEHRGGDGDLG
jgi:hypothetical protein